MTSPRRAAVFMSVAIAGAGAVAACSAEPEPQGLSPDAAINGTYAVLGKITKLDGRLNGENGFPTVVGDSIPSGDWTVVASCVSATECSADVVSSSGRKYALALKEGVWSGDSVPQSEPCEGLQGARSQSTQTFTVTINAPTTALAAPPNVLDGTQTRRYEGCDGTTTLEGTLSLTRIA